MGVCLLMAGNCDARLMLAGTNSADLQRVIDNKTYSPGGAKAIAIHRGTLNCLSSAYKDFGHIEVSTAA